jgi:hypothetical protein
MRRFGRGLLKALKFIGAVIAAPILVAAGFTCFIRRMVIGGN